VPSKDTVQFQVRYLRHVALILLPSNYFFIFLFPLQDLNSVSSFLISTVQSFLERHGFLASTSSMHASREGAGNNTHNGSPFPPSSSKKRRKLLEHSHGRPSPPQHPSSHPKIGPADSERPPTPSHYSSGDHDGPPIYARQVQGSSGDTIRYAHELLYSSNNRKTLV
jgi:hypothetical protein